VEGPAEGWCSFDLISSWWYGCHGPAAVSLRSLFTLMWDCSNLGTCAFNTVLAHTFSSPCWFSVFLGVNDRSFWCITKTSTVNLDSARNHSSWDLVLFTICTRWTSEGLINHFIYAFQLTFCTILFSCGLLTVPGYNSGTHLDSAPQKICIMSMQLDTAAIPQWLINFNTKVNLEMVGEVRAFRAVWLAVCPAQWHLWPASTSWGLYAKPHIASNELP